jgi:(1->4)-alpha-D-glucan 1-alpha-D-glucosylmutase
VLVVEDEMTIALLVEDMLVDLGHRVVGLALRFTQAIKLAEDAQLDFAILDVNLNGQVPFPVAEILEDRGIPFVFANGYGSAGVDTPYRGRGIVIKPLPDAADRAMLFQTLIGAWPMGLTPADQNGLSNFAKRITEWQRKALREAKVHSDWSAPNDAYERPADEFVGWLFDASPSLLAEIANIARRISPAGAVNSLGQVLAKFTAPGVPDIYQGTEYWDLSLVDPDNRAPVDFAARQQSLTATTAPTAEDWTDGRIKQFVISRVLAARKAAPALFAEGDYVPLHAEGLLTDHVFAFARVLHGAAAVTVFCRHPARLLESQGSLAIPQAHWKETRIPLPPAIRPTEFVDVISGKRVRAGGSCLDVAQVLADLPVALLVMRAQ